MKIHIEDITEKCVKLKSSKTKQKDKIRVFIYLAIFRGY